MNYYQECVLKFSSLPDREQELFGRDEVIEEIKKIEAKHNLVLGFLVILVAIDEISAKEMPEYLEAKYGVDKEKAQAVSKELLEKVFDPIAYRLDNKEQSQLGLDPIQKKEVLLKMFGENIAELLKKEKKVSIELINIHLIDLLFEDRNFQKEITEKFYNNEEKITQAEFIFEGKPLKSTVSNWLKDFIKKNGSGFFDNIILSGYITGSENAKKLNKEEREVLYRLLILYRNLRFFPDSMPSDSEDDWVLIPYNEKEGPESGKKEQKNKLQDVGVNPLVVQKEENIAKAEKDLSAKEDANSMKRKELENMLSQFPVGSLERKAIEEEIKKLL